MCSTEHKQTEPIHTIPAPAHRRSGDFLMFRTARQKIVMRLTDIYNPWSLIYAFDKGKIDNYWFATGTPLSLIKLLRTRRFHLPELEGLEVEMERFDAPTEHISDPIPVLFQSGYLTIKQYNPKSNTYTLGFPNQEVYRGFARSLYQYFAKNMKPK